MLDRIVEHILSGNVDAAIKLIKKNHNNMISYFMHRTAYMIIPFLTPASITCIEELIKMGLNPNAMPSKQTLLAEAVEHNNGAVVERLLAIGGDPYMAKDGWPNCFEIARYQNNVYMLGLLYMKAERLPETSRTASAV